MVNGVLYKANNDGSLSKMSFDGTTYGAVSAVNTSDALANQTDWHTDARTITSIFYSGGYMYYTKSGTNALYRRGFEVESGVVGQQRFQTTSSSINYANLRGAFVAGGKLYYAQTNGALYSATWDQAAHGTGDRAPRCSSPVPAPGWTSRAMFPYQAVPAPLNEAPVANAAVSCDQLVCTFNGTTSTDPENGPLTYDWDFGDGTAHGTGATTTHTYADAGDRTATLVVTDNKGATSSITKTASPTNQADSISFVASSNNNGNRTNHAIAVPAGTQVGDTMLLFFAANSTGPVYAGPAGWTQVLTQNGSSTVGKVYSKMATAADLGSTVTVTSRTAAAATYYVRSDTTLASYRGVGSPATSAAAITAQNVANPVHQTPTVNAANGTNWLVSFWTDKSSATTGWTGSRQPDPALRGQRDRQQPHVVAAHRQQRARQQRRAGRTERHGGQQCPGPDDEPAARSGGTASAQPEPDRARHVRGLHRPDLLLRRGQLDRPRGRRADLRLGLGRRHGPRHHRHAVARLHQRRQQDGDPEGHRPAGRQRHRHGDGDAHRPAGEHGTDGAHLRRQLHGDVLLGRRLHLQRPRQRHADLRLELGRRHRARHHRQPGAHLRHGRVPRR